MNNFSAIGPAFIEGNIAAGCGRILGIVIQYIPPLRIPLGLLNTFVPGLSDAVAWIIGYLIGSLIMIGTNQLQTDRELCSPSFLGKNFIEKILFFVFLGLIAADIYKYG